MKKVGRHYLLFSFMLLCQGLFAQKQDLTIVLEESILNKMFIAIGDIKGTSEYSFMFIDGTYDWTMIKPQIKLHANRADFVCDVKVNIEKREYTIHVTGNVEVCYEPSTNLIYVEVTDAKFPLNIYFFGRETHIWDVNLAKYFPTPFTFEGPLTIGTEMVFDMPDKTKRTLYAHPKNCGVKIAEKQITVSAEIEFVTRNSAK